MKKLVTAALLLIVVLSGVLTVSAYYDQNGTERWCNSDADGCWVTGEDGEKVYIMFWSEASREKFMGKDSNAPMGIALPAGKVIMPPPPVPPVPTASGKRRVQKVTWTAAAAKSVEPLTQANVV